MSERRLTRRELGASAAGLGLAGVVAWLDAQRPALEAVARAAEPTSAAATDVRATITAIADTVVPGPAGGADSAPGAVEAGAVDELYDELYGISGTFPALHADLLTATPLILGRPATFDLRLPYADREKVLVDRMQASGDGGSSPLYIGYAAVAIVVWFAYYGTARSDAGVRYIGFPPHSDGYAPRHSHHVRFRGMTDDGNPR